MRGFIYGGAPSTLRLMHNRGVCNVWLRIMRLTHDRVWLMPTALHIEQAA